MSEEVTLILTSISIDTIVFILASLSLWAILKVFDTLNNNSFKQRFKHISLDNTAAAIYYGFRILALAVLAATIYG